jgi:hypothetical protein
MLSDGNTRFLLTRRKVNTLFVIHTAAVDRSDGAVNKFCRTFGEQDCPLSQEVEMNAHLVLELKKMRFSSPPGLP